MFGRKKHKSANSRNRAVSKGAPKLFGRASTGLARAQEASSSKAPAERSRLKIICVIVFFALIWGVLWARAGYVQVVDGPRLAEKAKRQYRAMEVVLGERGRILDRNGRLLAKSVEFTSVNVKPSEVKDQDKVASSLSRILTIPESEIRTLLKSGESFKWVARQIGDKAAAEIRELNLAGVYLTTEYSRKYPNAHMAGQLIGFVGVDGIGLEGLELVFNEQLMGKKSQVLVQRDAKGRILYLDDRGERVDLRGQDLVLTIDSNIQFAAEEALAHAVERVKARTGSCLVVSVEDGDILAWAEYPFFNPNAYKKYTPEMRRNHIAADVYEPGSTMKPFLIAAALEEGIINPETLFYCEKGRWKVGRKIIRDTHAYDWLPVNKVLRYSSNIGSAKIGMELGAATYYDYIVRLGMGDKTGLPVSGESRGILRDPGQWKEIDLATAAFGQGIGFTALQMTQAYLCLANGGLKKPLRIIAGEDHRVYLEGRVFSKETADQVMAMMREVVEDGGTGTRARIEGVSVAGKTGTAQKASVGGYKSKLYMSSFVGVVPAEEPKYLVMVMVDEPETEYYGSTVAGPAFRDIAIRTMAYMADLAEVGYVAPVLPELQAGEENSDELSNMRLPRDKSKMPNIVGLPLRQAVETLAEYGVVPTIKGKGLVVARQSPVAGSADVHTQECVVWLAAGK